MFPAVTALFALLLFALPLLALAFAFGLATAYMAAPITHFISLEVSSLTHWL